jgi:hypothetical protein
MKAKKEKKTPGWAGIIVWLILFWPVGMILLFKRLNDKTALMSEKTKAPVTAAWILIALGVISLLQNIEQISTNFSSCSISILCIVGGVLILLKIRKSKEKAELYKKYLNAIVNVGERNIENIASAISVTYAEAQRDIQAMIDVGLLKGAYIHEGNRKVVLSQDVQAQQPVYATDATHGQATPQDKAIRCPGCGANNIVNGGRITECEYCGTPING